MVGGSHCLGGSVMYWSVGLAACGLVCVWTLVHYFNKRSVEVFFVFFGASRM